MDFDSILDPDAVVAAQFFDAIRRQGLPEGEYRLMIAVLDDAVRCYVQHAGSPDATKRALSEDARRWIEEAGETALYSFENVCNVLGIDVGFLRGRLRKQRHAMLAQRRSAAPEARIACS